MEKAQTTPPAAVDENQIIAERRAKLAAARELGQPFPNDFRRDALAADLHARYGAKTNEELEALTVHVAVAGRMMLKRVMGKASFATLQDMTGRIQLYVTADAVGADAHDAFKRWDLGDLVGATGHVFKTRTGELSIKVASIRLLAKATPAAPRKVPRAFGPGAALSPAIRGPHHQSGRRSTSSSAARRSCRRSANSSSRAATSRSRRR